MQEAFGIVIFVVVGVSVVIAVISLFGRSRLYDDIGRGGLSIGEDRDMRVGGAASDAQGAPVSAAEREEDIRQMLEARNARRAAQGRPTVDVERELAELTGAAGAASSDPEILEEVRQLVEARNARRVARGQEPLDVEAEIARQLRDLPG